MEVIGKITHAFEEVNGVSKAGKAWKKREYVLEYQDGQYSQSIMFDFFGDRADQYPLKIGQTIKLSFSIDSHEYNGKWFTSIRGWRAEEVTEGNPISTNMNTSPTPSTSNEYDVPVLPNDLAPSGPNDDLPF